MIRRPSSIICSTVENWFVSSELAKKFRLGLEELATIREQLTPLISLPAASAGVIERAAACAMLHSFYTEIEKLLKLIARESLRGWIKPSTRQKPRSGGSWVSSRPGPNSRNTEPLYRS